MLTAISPELLAKTLRDLRTSAGMSQAALARRAGINTETVSRIENNRGTTFKTFGKIADILPGLHQLNAGNGHLPGAHVPEDGPDLDKLRDQITFLIKGLSMRRSLETALDQVSDLIAAERKARQHPPKRATRKN